ncbi:MAG: DUF433 domain-containing protein [Methanomicrobiales archaeon]
MVFRQTGYRLGLSGPRQDHFRQWGPFLGTVVDAARSRNSRDTQQSDTMGGKACIRGMRVTVGMIVGQIGAGHSIDEVLADYPYLEREDILQALRYAAWRADEREIMLANG